MIDTVLAKDIDSLEPRLTRPSSNVKALAELLNAKPGEIRSFLRTLARQGFASLTPELRKIKANEPVERLVEAAKGYWRFAVRHQTMFELMHSQKVFDFGRNTAPPEPIAAFDEIRQIVEQASFSGNRDCDDLVDILHSAELDNVRNEDLTPNEHL